MANSKNRFEQLIEYIINEDEDKAKSLFHKIVVEKSRDIYESLVDEEQCSIERGTGARRLSDEIGDHKDEINGDEIGEAEEDFDGEEDFDAELGGDEFGDEEGGEEGDEMGDEFGDEEGGEEGLEDRVLDLESAMDELKAEFDTLMADEENEEENFPGIHDGDDEVSDEEGDDDNMSAELDSDEEGEEEVKTESASIYGEGKKSPAELMREYVEKVTAVKPSEGDAVGSGGTKTPINAKSTQINGKNDMGGTTANIAKGGTASDKDSNTGPKKPSNVYAKGEKKMGQDKYENSPAANTKGYDKKQTAKTKEGADTKGTQPVVKKSLNPGGKSGFKG